MLDLQKIRFIQDSKAHLLYGLANEYEECFICFVKVLVPTPVFFKLISGPRVSRSGFFIPGETMAYVLF